MPLKFDLPLLLHLRRTKLRAQSVGLAPHRFLLSGGRKKESCDIRFGGRGNNPIKKVYDRSGNRTNRFRAMVLQAHRNVISVYYSFCIFRTGTVQQYKNIFNKLRYATNNTKHQLDQVVGYGTTISTLQQKMARWDRVCTAFFFVLTDFITQKKFTLPNCDPSALYFPISY
jgi:hypothetical protein